MKLKLIEVSIRYQRVLSFHTRIIKCKLPRNAQNTYGSIWLKSQVIFCQLYELDEREGLHVRLVVGAKEEIASTKDLSLIRF